jgi:hypothetical protein
MTRAPILPPFRSAAALVALAAAVPLAAQQSPGGFSLPEPTPTPTPTPEGPADERAGVAIPPRAQPAPRITPAPVLTPEPSPAPSPLALPPAPVPSPARSTPAPSPAGPETVETPAPAAAPSPEEPAAAPAGPPPSADVPVTPLGTPDAPPRQSTLPEWWPWAAAALAALLALAGGVAVWRNRRPKVLRLAAPPLAAVPDEPRAPPRIDLELEITGATRSLMMFTLHYRLVLANRSDRAVNDLAIAVQLASAQRGQSNAAPLAAARSLAQVERIGPNQSRSIVGEVQMPLAAIAPIMQGRTRLFIPLVHVTLEGQGQLATARSFVVGNPGTGAEGRVQPLPLDQPPGSLPGLRARPIAPLAD